MGHRLLLTGGSFPDFPHGETRLAFDIVDRRVNGWKTPLFNDLQENRDGTHDMMLTDPEPAEDFVARAGVDALSVSLDAMTLRYH